MFSDRLKCFARLLCFFSIPLSVYGQRDVDSLLWKISPVGGGRPSYLFGTIHLADPDLCSWDNRFFKAFRKCRIVAGEIDLQKGIAGSGLLNSMMMKDSTLGQLVESDELARIRSELDRSVDPLTARMAEKMKPFFAGLLVIQSWTEGGDLENVPDQRIQSMARRMRKQVVGLEDLQAQLSVMDFMSYSAQADWLTDLVSKRAEYIAEMAAAKHFYLEGRTDRILEMDETSPADPMFDQKMLHDRNTGMTKGLLQWMLTGPVFCAVGAAHLAGPTGMVEQLRKAGFVVESVPFSFLSARQSQ
jgi:uncharacterized protein